MKYVFFLLGMISFSVSGQVTSIQIGIETGLCTANLWGSERLMENNYSKGGRYFGASTIVSFRNGISLKTGMSLERKGRQSFYTSNATEQLPAQDYTWQEHIDYVTIPLLFHYSQGGMVRLFFDGGTYVGVRVGTSTDIVSSAALPEVFAPGPHPYKRGDIGLAAGIGVSVGLSNRMVFEVGARDNLGLINIAGLPVRKKGAEMNHSLNLFCRIAWTMERDQAKMVKETSR